MDNPEVRNQTPHLSLELFAGLKSRAINVVSGARAMLERGEIEDEINKEVIAEAATFLENPSEDLMVINKQTEVLGQVIIEYDMQGVAAPTELDGLYACLLALQCIHKMNFVEKENEQNPDNPQIQKALVVAMDQALLISRAFKDDTLLNAVKQLQTSLRS